MPFALALGTFALTLAQSQRDRQAEERRATAEQTAARERAREDTLQTYLEQMSDLITNHGLRTEVGVAQEEVTDLVADARPVPGTRREPGVQREDAPPTAAQTLARTLTLVALRQLDPARKGLVVQFLMESDLSTVDPRETLESTLTGQDDDDGEAIPEPAEVPRVSLAGADLRRAQMPPGLVSEGIGRPLRAASFAAADLRDADFRGRDLYGVTFTNADLRGADLSRSLIARADFTSTCLSGARFVEATTFEYPRPPIFDQAEGRGLDLTGADLPGVDFAHARLTGMKQDDSTRVDFPPDWTPRGKRMSASEVQDICARFTHR